MARNIISKHEGTPYAGRAYGAGLKRDERRDVFSAELDYGASIFDATGAAVEEPVYTIIGSGESRGGAFEDKDWTWGTGTNLRVSRASIPALMRVLADLMEHEPEA